MENFGGARVAGEEAGMEGAEVAPPAGQLLLVELEILSAGAKMTIDAIAQLQQHRNKLHGAPQLDPWTSGERGEGKSW